MFVCICTQITTSQIERAAKAGIGSADMHEALDKIVQCGSCIPLITKIVEDCNGKTKEVQNQK